MAALDAVCRSNSPSLALAPPALAKSLVDTITALYGAVDLLLAKVFARPDTSWLPEYVLAIDMEATRAFAADLDAVDYDAFYPATCAAIDGLHFWILTMFVGLLLHVPPAVITWHLVNRYSMVMARMNEEVDVVVEGIVVEGLKVDNGKPSKELF